MISLRRIFHLDMGAFNTRGGIGYALSLLLLWALLGPLGPIDRLTYVLEFGAGAF